MDLELEQINEQLSEAQEAQHVLVGSLRNWEARLDTLHKIAENSDASVWGIKKRQADLELKTLECYATLQAELRKEVSLFGSRVNVVIYAQAAIAFHAGAVSKASGALSNWPCCACCRHRRLAARSLVVCVCFYPG